MENRCTFTFAHYEEMLKTGKDAGYVFMTCYSYSLLQKTITSSTQPLCVLRHDVDYSPQRSIRLAEIENKLGIQSTFFFRTHANEYNPLGYEVVSLIKDLDQMGHEIGLHVEPLDIERGAKVNPESSIRLGKHVLEEILGHPIVGMASHNDPTPDNNLRFFDHKSSKNFGLMYEAYDQDGLDLFARSTYVTDSYFWHWRTFEKGKLTDRQECLCHHFEQRQSSLLYCLTHPHCWYETHYHRVLY